MLSPYSGLYSNPTDHLIAWVSAAALFAIAVRRSKKASPTDADYIACVGRALLEIVLTTLAIFSIGAIGAAVKLKTVAWFIWEPLYGLSVICVFYLVPCLLLPAWLYTAVRWRRVSPSQQSLKLLGLVSLVESISVTCYFLLAALFRKTF